MTGVCEKCGKEVFAIIGGRCLDCWDGPRETEDDK